MMDGEQMRMRKLKERGDGEAESNVMEFTISRSREVGDLKRGGGCREP